MLLLRRSLNIRRTLVFKPGAHPNRPDNDVPDSISHPGSFDYDTAPGVVTLFFYASDKRCPHYCSFHRARLNIRDLIALLIPMAAKSPKLGERKSGSRERNESNRRQTRFLRVYVTRVYVTSP